MKIPRLNLLPPSKEGAILGYSGLVPFVFLSGVSFLATGTLQHDVLFALLAYAASIVSFLGAIHWGLTLRDTQPSPRLLVWGVVPSLLAWCALMLGTGTGLGLMVVTLWVCLAVDWKVYPRHRLQSWLGMRLTLTLVASASCTAAFLH